MQKIEIFRGSNGFALIVGQPGTSEMLVFNKWAELVEYLSDQAGLWGKLHTMPELSPDWASAPDWATHWESETSWIGEGGEREQLHHYFEKKPVPF